MHVEKKCPGCGAELAANVKEMQRVNCPRCNAGFVAWTPPGGVLQLRCVVRPVCRRVVRPN